jgi:hypothetical protein
MADNIDKNDIDLEFTKKDVFVDKPLQLIEFNGDRFELNQEALQIISSIEEDIVVVAIVGKARTGKSYLMNLLLDNNGKNKGVKQLHKNSFKSIQGSPHARRVFGSGEIIVNPSEQIQK